MAVRYHGCTCHQRYSAANGHTNNNKSGGLYSALGENSDDEDGPLDLAGGVGSDGAVSAAGAEGGGEIKPQPWYFHVVASLILVVHGFTFLVPTDPEVEDTDMVRTIAKWFGYEMEWVKHFTPYAQVCRQS